MPPSIDQILRKARRHAENGEADLALKAYKGVLEQYPRNRAAIEGLKELQEQNIDPSQQQINELIDLYRQGEHQKTLVHGEALARQFPSVPFIPNLLGAVNVGLGRLEQAVECYTKALDIKSNYAEAHNNLGSVLIDLGNYDKAVSSLNEALQLKPDYSEAHNNLGTALIEIGKLVEATSSFSEAVRTKPDFSEAHNNLGNVLNELGRTNEAVASYEKALQIRPGFAEAHSNLGNALRALGEHEKSISSLAEALKIRPDFAEAHNNMGNTLNDLGRAEEATAEFSRAIQIRPGYAEAHRNLCAGKKYQADDPQTRQILQLIQQENLSGNDRMHLNFALGKMHDDTGMYNEAFSFLADGNRLRKARLGYDISAARVTIERIMATFTENAPALHSLDESTGVNRNQSVFVLGMPRSGTSLVEQILASHSEVYGAGEMGLLGQSIKTADWNSAQLSLEQLQSVQTSYMSGLSNLGATERCITDKMPINFWWIGFIFAAISDAKIVHVKRDARATCWSNFKTYFAHIGNGFAYDLEDVAEFYNLYADLMTFWHEKFPGRIYDLNYEALTENQEDETRKLLEYCGLNWEDRCLEFHKTARPIQTASATQVRQKMYTGSSDQWRNYETHLDPMLKILN